MCLLGILLLKKGINVKCFNPFPRKFLVSCDLSFLEYQPFYPNAPLRGRQLVKTTIGTPMFHVLLLYHLHSKSSKPSQENHIGGESHTPKEILV